MQYNLLLAKEQPLFCSPVNFPPSQKWRNLLEVERSGWCSQNMDLSCAVAEQLCVSDVTYVSLLPRLEALPPTRLYVPPWLAWNGINDRFAIVPRPRWAEHSLRWGVAWQGDTLQMEVRNFGGLHRFFFKKILARKLTLNDA